MINDTQFLKAWVDFWKEVRFITSVDALQVGPSILYIYFVQQLGAVLCYLFGN